MMGSARTWFQVTLPGITHERLESAFGNSKTDEELDRVCMEATAVNALQAVVLGCTNNLTHSLLLSEVLGQEASYRPEPFYAEKNERPGMSSAVRAPGSSLLVTSSRPSVVRRTTSNASCTHHGSVRILQGESTGSIRSSCYQQRVMQLAFQGKSSHHDFAWTNIRG